METGLAISLTSNGHMLTTKLVSQLESALNFLRISVDGVGATYESIRGQSFEELLKRLSILKGRIPFGINYDVNKTTISDLSEAAKIFESYGAHELLLLPEEPFGLGEKIDDYTLECLKIWIDGYSGGLKLSVSSGFKDMVDSLVPLENESNLLAYAHIDAVGQIKRTSFESTGRRIDEGGVMNAFRELYDTEESFNL